MTPEPYRTAETHDEGPPAPSRHAALEAWLEKLDILFFCHPHPDKLRWESQVAFGLAMYTAARLAGGSWAVCTEHQAIAYG
jgi:hypothetical protein